MRKNIKITSFLLVIILVFSISGTASAAVIDNASIGNVNDDSAVIAADFDNVGTELESQSTLPSYYSSLDLGYTTPVRAQLYNTCWAYGSMATLETLLLKNHEDAPILAPMHLNYYGIKKSDGTGWQRTYQDGGFAYISLGYLSSWSGARLESEFPYNISPSRYEEYDKNSHDAVYADSLIYLKHDDIETVKTAIYEYGAVVGNYNADNRFLNSENNAFYCNQPGIATKDLIGHCISIVGWDDNYSKSNFSNNAQPQDDGAFLVKNSWGSYWGSMGGYFWISYEDLYLFDKRFGPSYAIASYEYPSSRTRLYQNETYGATYEFSYVDEAVNERTGETFFDDITYISVFDYDLKYNTLDKVKFESQSIGSNYNIYYIPLDESGVPTTDRGNWVKLSSGTLSYSGYYSIDVEDFKVCAGKSAIGVEIIRNTDDKGNSTGITIGCDEWLTSGGNLLFTPKTKKNDCYIIGMQKNAYDLLDFYKDEFDDDIGSAFVIKAVAKEELSMGDVDGDGLLTIIDATTIQNYLAQSVKLDEEQIRVADMDQDGQVTIIDATIIQKILAGLIDNPYGGNDSDFDPGF